MRQRHGKCLLAAAMLLTAGGTVRAQVDVSELFLVNNGFDTNINYSAQATGNVAQEILDVTGWTKDHSVDYTIVGTYAFGTQATFNTTGRVPAAGYDGSAACLALSTGWEQSLVYSQTITLPAGSYRLQAAWYNGSGKTGGQSLVGWVPTSGSSVMSSVASFPLNQWKVEEVTFSLTRQTRGKVQLGLKAVAGGSVNSAKPVLDYVKLMMDDEAQALSLIRTRLQTLLNTATAHYGDGTGNEAQQLKQAIDAAQTLMDSSDATFEQLLQAWKALAAADEFYINANASEDNPRDITTTWIVNQSFESGTTGWTINNMQTQTNSYFTRKVGSTYLESWVSRGSSIGTASATQTLKGLPRGKYRLQAAALHIQQTGSNSQVNSGAPQTGAALVAGGYEAEITSSALYKLSFVVTDSVQDVRIGVEADGATGNWLCVDNFRLYYTGAIDAAALTSHLQRLVERAQQILTAGVQDYVRQQVEATIAEAQSATGEDAMWQAVAAMDQAIALAETSRQRYERLGDAIAYAEKVLGWWTGVASKATAWNALQTAVETATQQVVDYSLTDTQLTQAASTLQTRTKAVDKRIYESGNAVGTGSALNNTDSEWCYQRSLQSKHWILFWDKGYGDVRPSGIDGILETADHIFEFYADSLQFLTINQGKSKTDTYKMIIRLRSSEEWEASGSGIDNVIGLLTLSRWAYTSRSGQTMAHEIGHCFQYQVHCDNNNQNGWMYTWADSPNGNVFWEMCAQWQAYKFYPQMQFDNEWLGGTLDGLHKHPMCEELRYNNYFIQDYMAYRQGMGFIGQLWNKSQSPEDPLQAYMRLTMSGTPSAQRLDSLGTEMWWYGARMTTFDMDHLRTLGKSSIGRRTQTAMQQVADGYWLVDASVAPENFGNNAIRLNAPSQETTVMVDFVGVADTAGYRGYRTQYAGWRVGFVAYKGDGTRYYGEPVIVKGKNATAQVSFTCPKGCSYLWLVVSGAPTTYWCRGWDGSTANDEQWPYRVYFYGTNLYGKTNNPTGIQLTEVGRGGDDRIFSLDGRMLGRGEATLRSLPAGVYVVAGRKVLVK